MIDALALAWPAPPLLEALASLWTVLVAATGAGALIARLRPSDRNRELGPRVRTWWMILGLTTSALLLGAKAVILLVAAASYLAFREFQGVVPGRPGDRAVLALAYLAIPIQFALVWTAYYPMFAITLPVYGFVLLAAATALGSETRGFIRATATLHWALMLTVYNLSHLAFLTVLPLTHAAPAGGVGLFLMVVGLVQFNDVAQYVWGRLFGRRKIVPSVSPGKTWAGFLGGVATTAALGALVSPWLAPFGRLEGAGLGVLLAVLGFLGDITLSSIKRDLGIKDTGASLPGHGGYLDRLDSLVLAAPVAFHVIRFFYGA